METAVTLLTITTYGAALYLWWHMRTPLFLFALIAGHIGALASPLWPILYGGSYAPDLTIQYALPGLVVLKPIVVASAWYYTLPAFVVFLLYRFHWWFSGYITGLLTFAVFFLYHALLEMIGLMLNIWNYDMATPLPFGIANWTLSSLMAAIISLTILYVLFLVHRYFRYPWYIMLMVLLPAPLLINLLMRGLLGAPIWLTLLFQSQTWAASVGMLLTLALLAWAVHIVAGGMARVHREIVV
jgi:hypothetical protein